MSNSIIHVPEEFRRGGKKEHERESVASGISLLQLMCKKLGIADLTGKDLLDMGCGNKFTQAILEAGGSRPAMESFKAFRGREPSLDALLRHQGMA